MAGSIAMRRGYSLVEIVLAMILLTGLFLAAFSVFDAASREFAALEHKRIAAQLAEKICEELRSKKTAAIGTVNQVQFSDPVSNYLYSIDVTNFPMLPDLQQISVTVSGPVNSPGFVSLDVTTLLSRAPYP